MLSPTETRTPTVPATRGTTPDTMAGPLAEAARWGSVILPAGRFTLHEVVVKRDLPLLHPWMNDPATARWWDLAGPSDITRDHLARQARTTHSAAYLGCLDDEPVSYWELYRADLDPLAAHYPARPHDAGVHLLIGNPAHRGRGLGPTLIHVVTDLILRADPRTTRVLAEPDILNRASVAAFHKAGYRNTAELTLPGKTAALMVRERTT